MKREQFITTHGVELIRAKRIRQIEKHGWTPAHDREHNKGELVEASAWYLQYVRTGYMIFGKVTVDGAEWPWDESIPKECDRKEALVNAGALIAAELDRMEDEQPKQEQEGGAK
jgi:hypothetical protein